MAGPKKRKIVIAKSPHVIANHKHPFSQGWRVGDLVFTGGIAAEDQETGRILEGDIRVPTQPVLDTMQATLDAAGSRMENVFKVTVLLTDINEEPAYDEVYREYFPVDVPGRMSCAVVAINPGVFAEIDAIAVAD